MVKGNFLLGGAERGAAIQASANYYANRPNQEGGRSSRDAFDDMGDGLTKEQVNGFLQSDEASLYKHVYRLVMSPGADLTGSDLKDWTREVLHDITMNHGKWIAWSHDDHTEHPHSHGLAFTDRKLSRDDFEEMRHWGDKAAEEILWTRKEMQQDPMEREQAAHDKRREQEPADQGREDTQGQSSDQGRSSERRAEVSEGV